MRGVHDTGVVFMIPTYLFTGTLLIVIAVGAWQCFTAAAIRIRSLRMPAIPAPRSRLRRMVAAAQGLFIRLHRHDRR